MYAGLFKPVFDLSMALLLSIILLPVFFVLAIVTAIVNRGRVLFVQSRIGKDEREFKIYKFKTLLQVNEGRGQLIEDPFTHSPMVMTSWGRFMRTYSLDEIPQLINVLLNDLSLVGPRPLLPEYIGHYSDEEKKRHQVKPGITGLAQVNGRNTIEWSQKLAFDVEYVKNISFSLDIKILVLTAFQWLRQQKEIPEISLIDYKKQTE